MVSILLTIERIAIVAVYIQALGRWLLSDYPFMPVEDDYLVYIFNRLQACRSGLADEHVGPTAGNRGALADHILEASKILSTYAEALSSEDTSGMVREAVEAYGVDTKWIRVAQHEARSLYKTV